MKLIDITNEFTKEQLDYMKGYDDSVTMLIYSASNNHRVIYSFNDTKMHLSFSQQNGDICPDIVSEIVKKFFGKDADEDKMEAFISPAKILHFHLNLDAVIH